MTDSTNATDADLFQRVIAGDEEAFTCLYRRRQGGLYRFALHMTGSQAAAEDVTQDVFLALMRQVDMYDPARGSVAAYLYGIARNLIAKHLGRRTAVALPDEGDEGTWFIGAVTSADDDPLEELTRKETVERVRQAIGTLPPHYREVVILCELQDVDYLDAAAALGCPIGTVRSRLHRARALLLKNLSASDPASVAVNTLEPARCLP